MKAPGLVCVALVLALLATACSDPAPAGEEITGVVVDVSGDLTSVESFAILDDSGAILRFVPEEGLTFHGGPLGHLREHVASGAPVVVVFRSDAGNVDVAVSVTDS